MSQHDYVIDNQAGLAFRSDLNSALAAIVSNNSGLFEPTTTYAHMWWADTTAGVLKRRNAGNTAWVSVISLTQGAAASGANSDITSLGNNTSTIYTTAGTSTAYTITPVPSYAAYAIGMSVMVNFNAASGASPTLQWNGISTPPNLVKENADGTYSNIAAGDIPINHRSRVTLISTTQALVEKIASPRIVAWAYLTMQGTSAPTVTAGFNVSSVSRIAAGQYTVNFTNPLSSSNYAATVSNSQLGLVSLNGGNSTSTTGIGLYNSATQVYTDGAVSTTSAIQVVM